MLADFRIFSRIVIACSKTGTGSPDSIGTVPVPVFVPYNSLL